MLPLPMRRRSAQLGQVSCFGPRVALCANPQRGKVMNNIIYIVGLVVIVLAVLGWLGFR